MTVTKREILVSIIMFFLLIGIGIIIDNAIIEKHILSVEKYNKALKIDNDEDTFKYAIDTEIGNILAYGTFKAVDTVTLKELKNDYMYIEKTKQRYTKHTRQVCNTDSKGNTHCHTEVYYEWDTVSSEEWNSKKVTFLSKEFNYSKFSGYNQYRLSLDNNIDDSLKDYIRNDYLYKKKPSFWGASVGDIRYYYYVSSKSINGTVFAKAINKTIVNESKQDISISIHDSNLQETIENKKSQSTIIQVVFWIIWIILTGLAIYGYMYLDNDYLED